MKHVEGLPISLRIFAALLGAALGGVASMGVLRVLNGLAFSTDFVFWLRITSIHSGIVFVLFSLWFVDGRPSIRRASGIANCLAAIVVGGLAAIVVPYGFVLIATGHAFITSGVATLVEVCLPANSTQLT